MNLLIFTLHANHYDNLSQTAKSKFLNHHSVVEAEFISTKTHPYLIHPLCTQAKDIAIETSFSLYQENGSSCFVG